MTDALEAIEGVEAVEPNLLRRAVRTPNDPEFPAQAPSLDTAHLPTAWDVAHTGATIVVAVLDTGVDPDHPDLAPNLVPGYDAVAEDTLPMDDEGHGTQVAGVVGAATDNGIGVAGVAWNTKIMPVKVLNAEGLGTDADIAQGIVWATDHGAGVVNLPLGGRVAARSSTARWTMRCSTRSWSWRRPEMPAPRRSSTRGCAGCAGRHRHRRGRQVRMVLQPRALVPPVRPRHRRPHHRPDRRHRGAYTSSTGTSFSSPIVAGVAALVLERHPGWGWFETADELIRTARDAGPAGVDDAYGFGIVDAPAALGVSRAGATSRPNLSGDAGNLQSAARAISTGAAASEAIGYEYDEDWFAFDVPAQSGATITVTPPVASGAPRAAELDPIVELYGPGGGLVSRVDDTFEGQAEALSINLGVGRHTVRVTNYMASAGPGPYTVQAALGAPLPSSAGFPPGRVRRERLGAGGRRRRLQR